MKVLFICSGNVKFGHTGKIVPFIWYQGESLKREGIELDYFAIEGRGWKNYLKHIPILKKHLKEVSYDILHAHYSLCGLVALISSPRKDIVVSFMGDDLYGDSGKNGRIKLSDPFYLLLGRMLQVFIDHIIVKSENLAQRVIFKKKMSIIPNGVDTEWFYPMDKREARDALGLNPNLNILLFLGDTKNTRKNFQLLRKASSHVKAPFEIITPFPTSSQNVHLYLNAADVLILPSYKEGSPNVIKEAMACNCPIVSTDVGDVRKVVGNTEGCYITSFKPEEMGAMIREALEYSSNKGRTQGRERIRALGYDTKTIARKIKDLYEAILKKD